MIAMMKLRADSLQMKLLASLVAPFGVYSVMPQALHQRVLLPLDRKQDYGTAAAGVLLRHTGYLQERYGVLYYAIIMLQTPNDVEMWVGLGKSEYGFVVPI
jgi:hypothetical protein